MKIKLFVNKKIECKVFEKVLSGKLKSHGHTIVTNNPDICISIGGDGTFLYMIHQMDFKTNIKYVGFNLGTLGFLTSFSVDEVDDFVDNLENLIIDEYSFEEINVTNKSGNHKYYSLNEVVIRNYINKSSRLKVRCNKDFIEEFVGDALVVSSSIGSSAYSLNLGGPLIYDKVPCLILSSIAPINNRVYSSMRNSIVFQSNKELTIEPIKDNNLNLILDGHEKNLKDVSNVSVKLANKTLKVLRLKNVTYGELINNKLL